MNPAEAAPRPHLGMAVLRSLALVGLTLGLSLVIDLVLLALVPAARDAFAGLFGWSTRPEFDPVLVVELALFVLFVLFVVAILRRSPPRSWRSRILFGLATLTLGVGALVLAACVPRVLDGFRSLFALLGGNYTLHWGESGAVLVALAVLPPLAVLLVIQWGRLHTWRWIARGYLALAAVGVYLAIDDTRINHPLTMEENSPSFPGADQSYAVLMRYGKQHPLGRDFRFKAPDRIYGGPGVFSPDAKEWSDWLTRNRADLEADWRELAPVWAWWNELNAFDRIGDLTPARLDAEIITFQPIRSVSQHACAIASLQALDGHGDEAFATLLPLVEVSRKLQPSARYLVRLMIARVVQRMAVSTADFVVKHAEVSPAAKSRFAAALAGDSGEAGARKIFSMEYAMLNGIPADLRLGDFIAAGTFADKDSMWRRPLNFLGPVLYNPRHTLNRYGELTAELEALAAHRETDKIDPRMESFIREENRRVKNRMGSVLLGGMVPSYRKLVESYWKFEDERSAFRSRLVAALP